MFIIYKTDMATLTYPSGLAAPLSSGQDGRQHHSMPNCADQ